MSLFYICTLNIYLQLNSLTKMFIFNQDWLIKKKKE